MREAGILFDDAVEPPVVQRRGLVAPAAAHLAERVIHVSVVFEQVQRLLHGPLDLREFPLSVRRAARIALLLRLSRRLHGSLPGLRRFAPELILKHPEHLYVGTPDPLARVDHHRLAHQPDAEPLQRVEQLRELQRREHLLLHHAAVVDEQVAVAFVP